MAELSPEQLNSLDRETLIIIINSLKAQLDSANSMLADNNRQIELLTEQIRIMNQRHFGKKSESSSSMIEGQMTLFDSFNEAEFLVKPCLQHQPEKVPSEVSG